MRRERYPSASLQDTLAGCLPDRYSLTTNGLGGSGPSSLVRVAQQPHDDKVTGERWSTRWAWLWLTAAAFAVVLGSSADSSYEYQVPQATAVPGALVGQAIDQGMIASVDEPVIEYFPQDVYLTDEVKQQITVEDLPTMRSGLAWNEWDVPLTDIDNNDLIPPSAPGLRIDHRLARSGHHGSDMRSSQPRRLL